MTVATPVRRRLLTPRSMLIGVTTAGLFLFVLYPQFQLKLGMLNYGRWFLDSYAILASNDAVQAGHDPYLPNPLDDLHRPHSYSRWWFVLGRLGVTRADNFVFGGLCVVIYVVAMLAGLRPRTFGESVWYMAVSFAPPALLAIVRANNDLIVFALMGIGALFLHRGGGWRWITVLVTVGLATGLKFYPGVAGIGVLLLRPINRFWQGLLTSLLVLVLIGASVWPDFGHAVFPVPAGVYSFGAPLLLHDLGWSGRPAQIGAAIFLLTLGFAFRHRGLTVGLAVSDDKIADRVRFIWAVALLLACFIGGISYAYRWIFIIWCAPWLWSMIQDKTQASARRLGARWACYLILFGVWSDGLFCMVINIFSGPQPEGVFDGWQFYWRLCTQPFIWLLMGMLTGWLLDAFLVTLREVRLTGAPKLIQGRESL